jgi:hypothetical protein
MVNLGFRWSVGVFFLCIWVMCIHWAAGPREIAAQVNESSTGIPTEASSIVLSETSFDFGEVDEGSVVSHDFIVKNTGKAELQISKVRPD